MGINHDGITDLANFPKAGAFWEACVSGKYRLAVYGGGIRGGKTFTAINIAITLHTWFPGSRSIIVRDTLDTLRKNTLPSMDKAIPSNFIKSYKGDPHFEWTFMNGSKMFFYAEGYEKDKGLTRWDGLEVNFIILEQMEGLQQICLDKSFERAGSYFIKGGKQPPPLIIGTVNPTPCWVRPAIYDPYCKGTLKENWLYQPALVTDNPYVPQEYLDGLMELKEFNPVKYYRYVEGDWDIKEKVADAFWHSFVTEEHVKPVEVDFSQPLHISFDENVNPYPALSVWQHIDNDIKQVHEFALKHPENKLRFVAKRFIAWAKAGGFEDTVFIYGDTTSDKEDAKLEKGQNYFTILAGLLRKEFNVRVRKMNKNPSVTLSADFVNSIYAYNYGGYNIIIGNNCKESIKDYTNAQEDAKGNLYKRKIKSADGIPFEEFGHFSDTKRYFICKLLEKDYRKFITRDKKIANLTGEYQKERYF